MSPGRELWLVQAAGADLAAITDEYRAACALLVPGRVSPRGRAWTREQLAESDRVARAERAARAENTRRGRAELGEAPAPVRLGAVGPIRRAEWALCSLAGELREHLGLPPVEPGPEPLRPGVGPALRLERGACSACGQPALRWPSGAWWHHAAMCDRPRGSRFVPAPGRSGRALDELGAEPTRTERGVWFRAARDWLARSGVHAVHGDLLAHTASEVRYVLLQLRRVTAPGPDVRVLHAPCPQCGCLASLRVDVGIPDRRAWVVCCHGPGCDAEWPLDQWDRLGELLGVNVRGELSAP